MIENGLDIAEPTPPRALPRRGGRRVPLRLFRPDHASSRASTCCSTRWHAFPTPIWGDDAQLMIFGGNLERQPEAVPGEDREAGRRRPATASASTAPTRTAEMPSLMRSVDWMIIPSIWWENSPIVIQEAFFHGRPMICSNIGGMAEKITDGVDGLHFRVASLGRPGRSHDRGPHAIPACGTACGPASSRRSATRNAPGSTSNSTTILRLSKAKAAPRRRPDRLSSRIQRHLNQEIIPMKRILVISPSGEVYDHDNVRWYKYQRYPAQHQPLSQHRRRLRLRFVAEAAELRQARRARDPQSEVERHRPLSTPSTTTSSCAAPTTSTAT